MHNNVQTLRQNERTLRLLTFCRKKGREGFATDADLNGQVSPKFLPKRNREPELLESHSLMRIPEETCALP
jgi:hypothetical protein